jgi:arsenate reductase (thioredoxin)
VASRSFRNVSSRSATQKPADTNVSTASECFNFASFWLMHSHPPYKILILCNSNSARSIFAEYLFRQKAGDRFQVYSAGSSPAGRVHPMTHLILREDYGTDPSGARSKSWDEFKGRHFDFIITVCDEAKETAPAWPGQPITAHWHSPDPLRFTGTPEQVRHFFFEVAAQIAHRIDLFCGLPDPKLDALEVVLIGEKCKI